MHFGLWKQLVPEVHWEGLVEDSQQPNTVILVCLYGFLGNITSVFSWWYHFVCGPISSDSCFIYYFDISLSNT